jgi:hypothetical protein
MNDVPTIARSRRDFVGSLGQLTGCFFVDELAKGGASAGVGALSLALEFPHISVLSISADGSWICLEDGRHRDIH